MQTILAARYGFIPFKGGGWATKRMSLSINLEKAFRAFFPYYSSFELFVPQSKHREEQQCSIALMPLSGSYLTKIRKVRCTQTYPYNNNEIVFD